MAKSFWTKEFNVFETKEACEKRAAALNAYDSSGERAWYDKMAVWPLWLVIEIISAMAAAGSAGVTADFGRPPRKLRTLVLHLGAAARFVLVLALGVLFFGAIFAIILYLAPIR